MGSLGGLGLLGKSSCELVKVLAALLLERVYPAAQNYQVNLESELGVEGCSSVS